MSPVAGRPGLRFLEVGVYEGRATVWLRRNVLDHPSARLDCVDPFVDTVAWLDQGSLSGRVLVLDHDRRRRLRLGRDLHVGCRFGRRTRSLALTRL